MWIILGFACNCDCEYCYEKHYATDWSINKSIYSIPLRDNETIFIFGGEPLLYTDTLRDIVYNYKNREIVVITNGKLLSDDYVEFFNKFNIRVIVSWDGSTIYNRRGYNFLEDHGKKDLFKKLVKSGIKISFSDTFYPLDAIEYLDEFNYNYKATTGKDIKFYHSWVRNFNLDIDIKRVKSDIYTIIKRFINNDNKYGSIYGAFVRSILCLINENGYVSTCANRDITIDITGRVYKCHCCQDYVGMYGDTLDLRPPMRDYSKCYNCIALPLCHGGCPFADSIACDAYIATAEAIIDNKGSIFAKINNVD